MISNNPTLHQMATTKPRYSGLNALEVARRAVKWLIFFVLCRGSLTRYYRLRASVLFALARLGLYEGREFRFLRKRIASGATVIDVGANFGVYTDLLARLVGEQGHVLAFEPLSPVFDVLATRIRVSPQIACFKQGISDQNLDQVQFKIPLLFRRIPEPALASIEDCNRYIHTTERASVITLDSLGKSLERVDFIKIDIEGHELQALYGARELLSTHRPLIQFEENHPEERIQLFEEFASEIGYHIAVLGSDGELQAIRLISSLKGIRNFYLVP